MAQSIFSTNWSPPSSSTNKCERRHRLTTWPLAFLGITPSVEVETRVQPFYRAWIGVDRSQNRGEKMQLSEQMTKTAKTSIKEC